MSTTTTTTLTQPTQQPNISYHPDHTSYTSRTSLRLKADPSLPSTPLPPGWPTKLTGPLVWKGEDWTDESQWVYQMNEVEVKEVIDAVEAFQASGKPLSHITSTTFPLPTLGPTLRSLSSELYTGRGFFVLRTLPLSHFQQNNINDNGKLSTITAYTGICSHIASHRGRQDGTGSVLAHIKDLRSSTNPQHQESKKRGFNNAAYTTDKQVFHTDAGDLIALLALDTAEEGGTSRISSSWTVYNELVEKRPDLVKVLSEDWVLDTFGADPPYTTRPLLYHTPPSPSSPSRIILQYSRRHFTGYGPHPRSPHIPPISEAQAEALDAIHFLAEKNSLALNFQKGDIQVINSLALVHARDAFRDSEEHTRHLIRLWLRDEEKAWETPEQLKHIWSRLYDWPDGVEEQRFPLEPEVRMKKGGLPR